MKMEHSTLVAESARIFLKLIYERYVNIKIKTPFLKKGKVDLTRYRQRRKGFAVLEYRFRAFTFRIIRQLFINHQLQF
jgi:hypothetical protein